MGINVGGINLEYCQSKLQALAWWALSYIIPAKMVGRKDRNSSYVPSCFSASFVYRNLRFFLKMCNLFQEDIDLKKRKEKDKPQNFKKRWLKASS